MWRLDIVKVRLGIAQPYTKNNRPSNPNLVNTKPNHNLGIAMRCYLVLVSLDLGSSPQPRTLNINGVIKKVHPEVYFATLIQ